MPRFKDLINHLSNAIYRDGILQGMSIGRLRPALSLPRSWNVACISRGPILRLLHFAIVGFPKTGTSTLMFYLRNHSQSIFMFPDERCELAWNQHVPLLKDIYKEYQPNLQMGIKCPTNLEVDLALKNYKKFFPATKFIVGLRHPVRWFESFYNFRITNVSTVLEYILASSCCLALTAYPVIYHLCIQCMAYTGIVITF